MSSHNADVLMRQTSKDEKLSNQLGRLFNAIVVVNWAPNIDTFLLRQLKKWEHTDRCLNDKFYNRVINVEEKMLYYVP